MKRSGRRYAGRSVAASALILLSGLMVTACGGGGTAPSTAAAPPPSAAAPPGPAAPPTPGVSRAAAAPAPAQLPLACGLVTVAQVQALMPQARRAEDLGFTCNFVDSQQRVLLEVAVQSMGSLSAKHMVNVGGPVVLAELSGIGSNAVYTYQKAQPNVPAHLTALAAVQDGVGVQVLLQRTVAGTAPGEPGFNGWKALLTSAVTSVAGAGGGGGPAATSGAGALPNPCGLVTVAQVQPLIPQAAQATPHGPLCAFDDASGSQVLGISVQREAADARALFFPVGLVTIGTIAGIGDSAAYEYQKPDLGVPGHLAAIAAVKGGTGVSIVFYRVLAATAPGQPGFAKWKALLAAAVAKLPPA